MPHRTAIEPIEFLIYSRWTFLASVALNRLPSHSDRALSNTVLHVRRSRGVVLEYTPHTIVEARAHHVLRRLCGHRLASVACCRKNPSFPPQTQRSRQEILRWNVVVDFATLVGRDHLHQKPTFRLNPKMLLPELLFNGSSEWHKHIGYM